VQAAGRVPVDAFALGVHALTLSAHKMGGPKGVGALVLPGDSLGFGDRLIRGGGQERGHRAGTENVAAIVGFGAAARMVRATLDAEASRLAALRLRFEDGLRAMGPVVVFGADAPRLPNTSCFAFPGVKSESAMILMDLDGVSVSSGAACSSGKVRRSHVLDAMGVAPDVAPGALRVSLGWTTTQDDIDHALAALGRLVARTNRGRIAA
jgi:cysteine desulfurase